MKTSDKAKALRVYISSTDKHEHAPLYETIVLTARRHGLAGATVHKGVMGFGGSSIVHSAKFWETNDKLPVVVEIVDEKAKLEVFFETLRPVLDEMRYGCLVTMTDTDVLMYKSGRRKTVFE